MYYDKFEQETKEQLLIQCIHKEPTRWFNFAFAINEFGEAGHYADGTSYELISPTKVRIMVDFDTPHEEAVTLIEELLTKIKAHAPCKRCGGEWQTHHPACKTDRTNEQVQTIVEWGEKLAKQPPWAKCDDIPF